ncbi:MAG: FKBP-type peptidyl-prolyl cis-trans isomerase [Myxococcales bacterium]|nr:FKBP-type peptidyl-prolyl cis-trans isomerase [Myxococcales bacterium]
MRTVAVVLALLASSAAAQTPKSEDEKTIYALGLVIGKGMAQLGLSISELGLLKKGISDAVTGAKPLLDVEQYRPKLQAFATTRAEAAEKAVLEKAAKQKGAQALPSGIVYQELAAGSGQKPAASDTVKVHYRGTLTDGTEFDSSYGRGQPMEFPLNQVIRCWTDGVQQMKTGGKAKLTCPSKLAYGEQGRPPKIPPNSTLVFEIELLEVRASAPPNPFQGK